MPEVRTLSDENERTWIDELEDIEHVMDVRYPTTANGHGGGFVGAILEWESIVPFASFDLPPFPVDALPPILANFARAEAESTQTPVDMSGMLALGACACAIGRAAEVEVKPDYREPLNLFVAVVLPPGERKSAVMRHVTAPITDWERTETERMKPQIAHAAMKMRTIDEQLKTQMKAAARAKSSTALEFAEAEIEKLTDKMSELKMLAPPRRLVDDVTPEALISLMAQSDGVIGQFSAEGGVFKTLAGRYSDNVPLDAYLKGHAGDEIRVDRRGRPSEFVPSPCLSLGLAVQPSVLESFADNREFRGTGLLARFLYSLPSSKLGFRNVDPPSVPQDVRDAYSKLLQQMLTLPRAFQGKTFVLKMNAAARQKHFDFARWVEPQLAEFSELEQIRDWAAKLSGAVVRISGIFSVVRVFSNREPSELNHIYIGVDSDAVERAIVIGKYLVAHALAAFSAMGLDERVGDAKAALRCIQKQGWTSFTRSQIQQQLRHSSRFKDGERIDAALTVLEHRRFVRALKVDRKSDTGRKPGPAYEVNPVIAAKNAIATENVHPMDAKDLS